MHGSFGRFQKNRNRTDRDWNVALFALPVLIVIALEAAQAEFVGMNLPDVVPAQPAMQIRTVKAY
jgi:hypothetical protein